MKKIINKYHSIKNWDLREIKGGLIWCKVGYPTLDHQLNVVKGGVKPPLRLTVCKCDLKLV